MFNLIITGATGTAGSEALRQALLHPSITHVTVLSRRALPPHIAPSPPSPKLTVIENADFLSYPPELLERLKGADGVLWDLGISANGFKEKDYEVITKDYAVAAAKAFARIERPEGKGKFVFAYLSGMGADQEEKAWAMFGRVKGRAETAIANLRTSLPTLTSYSFRPAGICPVSAVPEASFLQRHVYAKALFPIFGAVLPQYVITTDVLARGMLQVVLEGGIGTVPGWEGKGEAGNGNVFETAEIKKLAQASALNGTT